DYEDAEADLLAASEVIRGRNQAMIEVDVALRLAQLAYARGDLKDARRRAARLEQQELPKLRTDLADEFSRLQADLSPSSGRRDVP
ncbi:MAG: hypothetical protein L3K06_06515, partial [Thermoplasmata archaeon]|nr:hypothetical protein [Thermoplasmata archaeon]